MSGVGSKSRRGLWKIGLLAVAVSLTGCSNDNLADLKDHVEQVKASRKGRVPSLPEFAPVESYAYSAAGMGDPFLSWQVKANLATKDRKKKAGSGIHPDMQRRREPLESFPLDTLRMVGTMERKGKTSALIRSPDGLISRVTIGNYLGQNHGRVKAIRTDKVELTEIVPDGLGGWMKRPASMALVE